MYMYMQTMHVSTMQTEIFFLRTGYRMPERASQKTGHAVFRSSRGRISYPASNDAGVVPPSLCCWPQRGIWSAMESSSQL